jgi:ABC-type transport system involved in cytochrome bd biosynthesis fused ATPase/permease subunit
VLGMAFENMRAVKFYGIENIVEQNTSKVRDEEGQRLTNIYIIDSLLHACFRFTPLFMILAVVLLLINFEGKFDTAMMFTVMLLLDIMLGPLQHLPHCMRGYFNASQSYKKIVRLLAFDESNVLALSETECKPELAIELKFEEARWYSGKKKDTEFKLSNVDLSMKKGEFSIVFGRIGQGKTSLLHALLNEIDTNQATLVRNV